MTERPATGRRSSGPGSLAAMAAIANMTLRALLGRRRTLLMLLLAGAPVLLGILVRLGNGTARPTALVPTLEGLVVTTVLPLVALVFGTAALGSELDDGTAVHIMTKPIPRWAIIVPKLIVAGGLTAGLMAVSTLLCGIFLGGTGGHELAVTVAFVVGVIVGSFVYVAIFLALSAATSRGLLLGLGYSLLWEGLLAGVLPGTQLLSVREYVRGIVAVIGPPETLQSVTGGQGALAAAVALILLTLLATERLSVWQVRSGD